MSATKNSAWVNKYRPTKLEQLALSDENKTLLRSYLDKGEIPNLLLAGPPGIGKTTLAKIIVNELDCRYKLLNASMDRGIDTIRHEVAMFTKSKMVARWNVVIMDEADSITRQAQDAMRFLMEAYTDQTVFILTANYAHKIIDAIRSRCTDIELADLSIKERALVLARILKQEDIEIDKKVILSYAKRYTDLRRMINKAQESVIANEGELLPAKESVLDVSGDKLWGLIDTGQWDAIVNISKNPHTDHTELLKELFWAVPGEPPLKAAQLRSIVEEQITNSAFTPDPVVHFLGTCSKLIKEL